MALSWLGFWIAVLFLIVGLLGNFIPAIPGVGFMWIVVLVYAILDHFTRVGPFWFSVLTVLGLVGATADYWLGMLGARVGGASVLSTLLSFAGGLLGAVIGLFIGGIGFIPGAWIGSILGVMVSEYIARKDWRAALRATLGLVVGFTVSNLVQFAFGLVILTIFIWRGLQV